MFLISPAFIPYRYTFQVISLKHIAQAQLLLDLCTVKPDPAALHEISRKLHLYVRFFKGIKYPAT